MSPSDLLKSETIEWKGRQWTLRRAAIATERMFKAYLERAALASVVAHADLIGEGGTMLAIQAVSRDGAARYYAWGRQGWSKCLEDDHHFSYLLWLMLTQDQTQRDLAFDDGRADQLKMTDFFKEKRAELTFAWNTLLAPEGAPVPLDVSSSPSPTATP